MGMRLLFKNKNYFTPILLALILTAGVCIEPVNAQKMLLANPDLDQCANGPQTLPLPSTKLPCSGSNWQNGNLNGNNSQYVEGDSVTYRAINTGGAPGSAGSLRIEYDVTKATGSVGKHAIDYLTTYDRSNPTGNNPCSGVAGCSLAVFDTEPIPADPDVPFAQIPGDFYLFGGTITSVSGYTCLGGPCNYATNTVTRLITVNFTFGATGNVVLAWGGHISRRFDWGTNNTAIAISGAPYHTEVGGSQASMQVEAVIVPASVTIVKLVTNLNLTYSSSIPFGFTTSTGAPTLPASFSLTDSNPAQFSGGSVANSSIVAFTAANTITVSENIDPLNIYTLADITCTEVGGGIAPVLNTTTNFGTRTATIIPDEGEFITCTFSNTQLNPTAAHVNVSGRVVTSNGAGITRARVVMTDQSGNIRTATTNNFGFYRFDEVEIGQTYVISVISKQYQFTPRMITLNDEVADIDFIAF